MKKQGGSRALWVILAGAIVIGLLLLLPALLASSDPLAAGPDIVPVTDPEPAGEESTGDLTTNVGGFSMGPSELFSLAWRLGLVGIIVALAVVGLRWWARRSSGPRSTTGFLRVVDTLAINNDRTLHLVALGERVITIGATQQQITFLNELTSEESEKVLAQIDESTPASFSGFADELMKSLRRERPRDSSGLDSSNTVIGEDRL